MSDFTIQLVDEEGEAFSADLANACLECDDSEYHLCLGCQIAYCSKDAQIFLRDGYCENCEGEGQ